MPYLSCSNCSKQWPITSFMQRCKNCNEPLEITYDSLSLSREKLNTDKPLLEKYFQVLPLDELDRSLSLGEGDTPLLNAPTLGNEIGVSRLYLKDETTNPTGSFKDRGTACEIQQAVIKKDERIATVSTGNMGVSVSAYAARAGLPCFVFVDSEISDDKIFPISIHGPNIVKVAGDYSDLVFRCQELARKHQLYFTYGDTPLRVEGQKTTAYEICYQLNFNPPDYIVLPLSSGGHMIAIIKGLKELTRLGLINQKPLVVGVQAEGTSPIAEAIQQNRDKIEHWENPDTIAHAISNPYPSSGNKIIQECQKGNASVTRVTDREILCFQRALASKEGIFVQPAAATPIAAIRNMFNTNQIKEDARVVAVLTGDGLKDMSVAKEHEVSSISQYKLSNLEHFFTTITQR